MAARPKRTYKRTYKFVHRTEKYVGAAPNYYGDIIYTANQDKVQGLLNPVYRVPLSIERPRIGFVICDINHQPIDFVPTFEDIQEWIIGKYNSSYNFNA